MDLRRGGRITYPIGSGRRCIFAIGDLSRLPLLAFAELSSIERMLLECPFLKWEDPIGSRRAFFR